MVRNDRLRADFALGDITAKRFPSRTQILNFGAVFRRPVERKLDAIFIVEGNAKARAKLSKLVFVEFFLLVRDVLAFPSLA